jgi:hypothetical protein
MVKDFSLTEETLGYVTSPDPTNSDKRMLAAGSKNVLISYQKKVEKRAGYTRLGAANTAATEVRNAFTWNTSTGTTLPQRFYDDELEVYLGTIDTVAINTWTRISQGWSTTEKLRSITQQNGGGGWFDATENIDLQIMVQGDDNLYEWNGAVAVVASVTATEITKNGTTTFAQSRFYTTRNKVVVCVRTGTEYTYTGGENTLTLTGIADTTDLVAGDILVQKVVTATDKPTAGYTNHTIYCFENQIVVGSEDNNEVYISKNNDYDDFAFSSPRLAGEGALLTLDEPNRAISSLGSNLLLFSGMSSIFRANFETVTVGSSLTESLKIKKVDTGTNQGALNHESVVPINNAIAYLTNEVTLRIVNDLDSINGLNPKTFSNPIKPDFDAEDWTGAFGFWYKNILHFTAPVGSRMYMLNFMEDANGKVQRFWNPPQVFPIGALSLVDSVDGPVLHGHSNYQPETYLLFDGQSDGQYTDMATEEKLPIEAKAVFSYDTYGKRALLKAFDEYYVDGEITPTTEVLMELKYDYDGATQEIEKTIDGDDEDILGGVVQFNSLAQQSLGVNPLGGFLTAPSNARRFRVVFEIAKEDFHELQATFSSTLVDNYWAIISHGANAELSPRQDISIKK